MGQEARNAATGGVDTSNIQYQNRVVQEGKATINGEERVLRRTKSGDNGDNYVYTLEAKDQNGNINYEAINGDVSQLFDPDSIEWTSKMIREQLPQTSWFKDSAVAQSISTWTTAHPTMTKVGIGAGALLAYNALTDD